MSLGPNVTERRLPDGEGKLAVTALQREAAAMEAPSARPALLAMLHLVASFFA